MHQNIQVSAKKTKTNNPLIIKWTMHTNLRWDILGGLNSNCGVPFTGRQNSDLI